MGGPSRPLGTITRGTTNPNRLRRVDRWMEYAFAPLLRQASSPPWVVDLGYGASPVTAVELARRMRTVRHDVRLLGLEIDPQRVKDAAWAQDPPARQFAVGGFEIPMPRGERPLLVRAFNVLRQYDESQVRAAWDQMVARLAPGGAVVEGTCDEIGRLSTWVHLRANDTGAAEPVSLSLAWHLRSLADQRITAPSMIAERLPKVLIHRNVPGEPIHRALQAIDQMWERSAPMASYGVQQRFIATAQAMRDAGWPVLDGPKRWRNGEITFAWSAVEPNA